MQNVGSCMRKWVRACLLLFVHVCSCCGSADTCVRACLHRRLQCSGRARIQRGCSERPYGCGGGYGAVRIAGRACPMVLRARGSEPCAACSEHEGVI